MVPRRRLLVQGTIAALLVALCVTFGSDAWAAARGFYARLTILSTIVRHSRDYYVDPVDTDRLMDGAIDGLLDRLDPHSNYLPADEAARLNERLTGRFGGVGIQYSIIDGSPTVISVIEGGPAENAGVITGDRIVTVDDAPTVNWRVPEVQEHLKGEIGTSVRLGLDRAGERELVRVAITRGVIPLRSVPYAFMLHDSTGYIRISNFARTTGAEFRSALDSLVASGMRQLVLDLRNNGGGDMRAAVLVCNNFLPEGTTIVSQRGRWRSANQAFYASAEPTKLGIPIVVMINHGSASASEIVAGALQDTDRAIIVGQRSFGKGLVQRTFDLGQEVQDGGTLLLTVARYYTPTGRCIQRDYSAGEAQYYAEGFADESRADTARGEAYVTPLGRTLYAGGGIRPDIPLTAATISRPVVRLRNRAAFFRFADLLVRDGVRLPASADALHEMALSDEVFDRFVTYAGEVDPQLGAEDIRSARDELVPYIASGMAGRSDGHEAAYRLLAPYDPELQMAHRHMDDARSLLRQVAQIEGGRG